MNGSGKVLPTHLSRQAVLYLRQSSPRQVRENRESAVNQRALREVLLALGWKANQITVIDADQGVSAAHADGRDGFQRLVADVGLHKVGIVIGYEVSRLSRNNADWHHLLELCGIFDTLIADADGIYHPRDFNDRLLLGLKGTMSEAELHSLRLRLEAGRLSKARRGELVQLLPTGYIRDADGSVQLDPDRSIQERIRLVFQKFLELGSAQKVLRFLGRHELRLPRRQTRGPRAGEVLWKPASDGSVRDILKNPAYAGAFVLGRRVTDPALRVPGKPSTGRPRQPLASWRVLVPNVYPAYISWEEFEYILQTMQENAQWWSEWTTRPGPARGGTALLTGLVRCALCGRAMRVSYKPSSPRYVCDARRRKYDQPSCQRLPANSIDEVVREEFFRALQPAEIDALEQVLDRQAEQQRELLAHLDTEVTRLRYEAARAERQYNCVDPENRLIAAELERKWESALGELQQAQSRLQQTQTQGLPQLRITKEMRQAFADVGRHLPELWPHLSAEARQLLVRTLVVGVHLRREAHGTGEIRIVWRGGLVTTRVVRLPVLRFYASALLEPTLSRIRALEEQGLDDAAMAEQLNREGMIPSRSATFTPQNVLKLRCRYGIRRGRGRVRQGGLEDYYNVNELTRLLGTKPGWIYQQIYHGRIAIDYHPRYGCYLFPRKQETIDQLRQLRAHTVRKISFRKEQSHG